MSRSIDEAEWEPVGELAQEALELARTSGDTETLVSALMVRTVCYTGTALFEEKLALADELVALGQAGNDAYIEGQGRRVRGGTRLALGDLAGFEEDQKAIEEISARTGNWLFVALAAQWRGLQAMLGGRFEDARASANEIVTHAGRDPNYGLVSVAVILLALWEQGRLDEVLPLLEAAVADSPQLPGFQAGLVFVQAELGNLEAARQRFELVAANDFVDLAHDTVFTITVAMLTEACAILEDAARASLLYDLLAPFADRLMIVGFGATCLGSADRYLGMLAATIGRDAEAEAHFQRALDAEEALDAPPLMARTHLWWARFERRRGRSAASAEHFRTALDIATQFGMTGIALAAQ
jgi:tetratricopeptide (TPR) repeat protein